MLRGEYVRMCVWDVTVVARQGRSIKVWWCGELEPFESILFLVSVSCL